MTHGRGIHFIQMKVFFDLCKFLISWGLIYEFLFSSSILLEYCSESTILYNEVSILPTFSSVTFVVSSLMFCSMMHVELTFVLGLGIVLSFFLLHVAIGIDQFNLLKLLSIPHILWTIFLHDLWVYGYKFMYNYSSLDNELFKWYYYIFLYS